MVAPKAVRIKVMSFCHQGQHPFLNVLPVVMNIPPFLNVPSSDYPIWERVFEVTFKDLRPMRSS